MLSLFLILKNMYFDSFGCCLSSIFTEAGHNTHNGSHIGRHLEFPKELKEDKMTFYML